LPRQFNINVSSSSSAQAAPREQVKIDVGWGLR